MAQPSPARNTLPAAIAPTLGKLIRRLGSDHDGEIVATVYAIRRKLELEGRDLHDLANQITARMGPPVTDWRAMTRYCAERQDQLTMRELNFIISIARWRCPLTNKQSQWLTAIYERLIR